MKKLTKNNLARMATLLPELNAEHQRGILGGTAVAIGTSDYTEMIPVPTVVTSTVDPYAMTESIAIPVSTAPVPTTTVSPVASTMPVPTVTMAPVETSESVSMKTVSPVETVTVPPVPTSSTLMPTSIPVSSTDSVTASTMGDYFWNFCRDVWDWGVNQVEAEIDTIVYIGSLFTSSVAEGIAYGYLDFKYNGLNAGNGIGNIPYEEYMKVRNEYHTYNFSFEKGICREESMLPEKPTYSDFRKMVDVVTLPGFVNMNVGNKIVNYVMEKGVNGAIHYGIDKLLDLGEQ